MSCGHYFCTSCIKKWFKIPGANSGRTIESEELIGELRPPQSGWRPRTNQQQEISVLQEVSVPQEEFDLVDISSSSSSLETMLKQIGAELLQMKRRE